MRTIIGSFLVLAASLAGAQNFVTNGDFSGGNAGFSTEYTFATPATNAIFPEGTYTIAANTVNPFVLNTAGIVDYNDHTSGTGLFMLVNGSSTKAALVWGQTLTGFTIGQSYEFDAWVSRWTPNGGPSASLEVSIDGNVISAFNDPAVGGVWEERSGGFVATSTSAVLQIRDLETALGGNDFSLDDISVQAVPEPSAIAVLGLGSLLIVRRRRTV